MRTLLFFVFVLGHALAIPSTALGDTLEANVLDGGSLSFAISGPAVPTSLTVAGNGVWVRKTFSAGETPRFSPYEDVESSMPDGIYSFELRQIPETPATLDDEGDRRASPGSAHRRRPFAGKFQVSGGTLLYMPAKPMPKEMDQGVSR